MEMQLSTAIFIARGQCSFIYYMNPTIITEPYLVHTPPSATHATCPTILYVGIPLVSLSPLLCFPPLFYLSTDSVLSFPASTGPRDDSGFDSDLGFRIGLFKSKLGIWSVGGVGGECGECGECRVPTSVAEKKNRKEQPNQLVVHFSSSFFLSSQSFSLVLEKVVSQTQSTPKK